MFNSGYLVHQPRQRSRPVVDPGMGVARLMRAIDVRRQQRFAA
jgi:hypothetical protein